MALVGAMDPACCLVYACLISSLIEEINNLFYYLLQMIILDTYNNLKYYVSENR